MLAGAAALSGGCGATPSPLRVQRTVGLPSPGSRGSVPLEQAGEPAVQARVHKPGPDRAGDLSAAVGGAGGHRRLARAHQPIGGSALSTGAASANRWGLRPLSASRPSARGACRPGPSPGGGRGRLGQTAVRDAPLTLVIAAVYARTEKKHGARGHRYVELEAGHAAQTCCCRRSRSGSPPFRSGRSTTSGSKDRCVYPRSRRRLHHPRRPPKLLGVGLRAA